jgi:adenylate cyclase
MGESTKPSLALPDKPSIAVLPFQNMSGDPEQEYFADGIAEDIITLLSKSRGLFVIARNSTFTYRGRAINVKTVARELGVRYVLEGSTRKAGNRVRVTAQLIEAATGGHLWADRYDRDLADIFAVQDEITASVSGSILPAMERSERERAARKQPDSLDGWECYYRGQWHLGKLEPAQNECARNFFQRAIELDPGFAAAYSGIALTYLVDVTVFVSPARRSEFIPRATEHARRSIEVDPTHATGHCALSYVLMLSGRHEEAMAEADIAVSLDPNYAWAYASQGSARTFGGWPREGIEPLNTAIRLSPFDPQMARWLHHLARAHYFLRDYGAAVVIARQACHSFPNYRPTYRALIASLGQLGQVPEAQNVMSDAVARYREDIRFAMVNRMPELREADHVHMMEGYRKAGVIP